MTKVACQYAIVRFMPFIETGEFANVGVVMMSARNRYFGFQLQKKQRHARITRFFDGVDAKHYRAILDDVRDELDRAHSVLKAHGFDRRLKANDEKFARALFAEIIRFRESIVRFSEPRIVLTDNPNRKLKELFAYYIERNFVTKQYQEAVLETGIRRWLKAANIQDRFQSLTLGDEEYQATFPFVEVSDDRPVKAIKPLYLGQDKTIKIIDHGAIWAFKIRQLRKRDHLPPHVMFAVAGPEGNSDGRREHAFQEAVNLIKETGVAVVGSKERTRVLAFATMN